MRLSTGRWSHSRGQFHELKQDESLNFWDDAILFCFAFILYLYLYYFRDTSRIESKMAHLTAVHGPTRSPLRRRAGHGGSEFGEK